nr:MAG: hypothetical protein DIU78_19580 [Pseudomonadota bacterium]
MIVTPAQGRPARVAARRFSVVPRALLAAATVALALAPSVAAARPQWSIGAVPQLCWTSATDDAVPRFCGTLTSDLLLFRERVHDFGVGPYVSVGTFAFRDLRLATGARALFPILEDFPLVLSTGALAHDDGRLGVDGSLFFGARSYNFSATYNFAAGVVLGVQHTLSAPRETTWTAGLQVDGFIIALPFLLAWGALH